MYSYILNSRLSESEIIVCIHQLHPFACRTRGSRDGARLLAAHRCRRCRSHYIVWTEPRLGATPAFGALNPRTSLFARMAVFLINACKFSDCGLVFHTLGDLIQHIEDVHIVTDPRALEKMEAQQPGNVACSYIFRFFGEVTHQPSFNRRKAGGAAAHCVTPPASVTSGATSSSLPSNATPNSSDNGEGDAESDAESTDSWAAQQEFATQLIVSMMSSKDNEMEKPFCCPIPGCKKRYKNINGVKYHARHGHRKHPRERTAYKCFCGKSCKSEQALLTHSSACRAAVTTLVPSAASAPPGLSAADSAALSAVSMALGSVGALHSQPAGAAGTAMLASKLLLLPSASLNRGGMPVPCQTVLTMADRTG